MKNTIFLQEILFLVKQKTIKGMDTRTKERIRDAILKLTKNPPEGDIKPMQGKEFEGCFRVRIGSYRVIYRYGVENSISILFVIKIGSRGDIYK